MLLRGGVMDLVRLPSLLPLLALFSSEESRVVVVRKLLEKLTTVEEVVEDKVTIGGIIFFVCILRTGTQLSFFLYPQMCLGALQRLWQGLSLL